MRDVLLKFGVDAQIDVVPNGVALQPFKEPAHRLERGEFGFGPEDVIFIYTGRLGPEKNLTFLLRSFAGTAETYDHVRLLVVGDGPERDNLQALAEHLDLAGRVRFTGMVPYADLPGYLHMADAFVTASITEVHPLSVIEAMAAGKPVLGIESPGISDTVVDGITGLLAKGEELAGFTARMVRLATDLDMRQAMGQHACQAVEVYAIENTVLAMLKRYDQVALNALGRKRGLRTRLARLADNWRS
jgi:glycosyltransferase involved in cell wall biosynthesis